MPAARPGPVVVRSHLAWPLVIPLLAAGSLAGHDLAYRIVVPDAAERAHYLERTGHAYLAYGALAAGIAAALLAAALTWRFLAALRGDRAATAPAWLFALLAPAAFTLQEHGERLLHDGAFPVGHALEPTFLVGLALQLPFALGALLVARLLEEVAEVVVRALPRVHAATVPLGEPPAPVAPLLPRPRPLALRRAARGPPLPA